MLLMIDNYDSFTYNLVQYFGELGQHRSGVFRNDQYRPWMTSPRLAPDYGSSSRRGPVPRIEAGISLAVVERHQTIRRRHPDPRCLPRPPEHCSGAGRASGARPPSDARQDFPGTSHRAGAVYRLTAAAADYPLPLAGGRTRHAARLSAGHRLDRARERRVRRDYGLLPPRMAAERGTVSP